MVVLMIIRTYSELRTLKTFEERFRYLRLNGTVGKETFGFDRLFNQKFYTSKEWLRMRDKIIVRDNGCDLGVEGHEIGEWQDEKGIWHREPIYIHHMNPISLNDIMYSTEYLLNPEYLILTTHPTHNAIHYGDSELLFKGPVERTKNDTCPWRQ